MMWRADKKPEAKIGARREKFKCRRGLCAEKVITAGLYGRGKQFMLALPASKSGAKRVEYGSFLWE
ncbi:MAG: hypothetical protein ACI9SB_002107 [Candidatus Azotimanducaceae bacterium]|jgi:hypothetical protein